MEVPAGAVAGGSFPRKAPVVEHETGSRALRSQLDGEDRVTLSLEAPRHLQVPGWVALRNVKGTR